LTLGLIGIGVIFAALGLGEAVYRFLFLDFDGSTDRLPIEMLFGLAFAWMATKLARRIYQHRMETSARIALIRERNYKIRRAVEAITPVPYPSNQQAIRVIREEVDRIEWTLTEIIPRGEPVTHISASDSFFETNLPLN
jgi:NADH:ubiquinone oxidoreductase subunit D